MTDQPTSGDGERGAILGYYPQYVIAADLIYSALLDGSLESVRVADPEAGAVDDIQLITSHSVDAYQVKWSEFVTQFSFSDLIRPLPSNSGPSLFKELVLGWMQLRAANPGKTIRVHLLHHAVASPSTRAQSPLDAEPPEHPHFQAFLRECW